MQVFKIEKNGSKCIVTWRHFSIIVYKWLVCIVIWPLICIVALNNVLVGENFAIDLLGFVIVMGGWLWGFALVVNGFFGETRLILDENGVEIFWSCRFQLSEKWIDLSEIRWFEKVGNSSKAGRWHSRLRVVCNESSVNYIAPAGFLTPASKELDNVCDQLNTHLAMLNAGEFS
jgi:hypothetical protein